MTQDRLKEHYEWRYAHEKHLQKIEVIAHTPTPTDRFEAAAHYLPTLMSGGNILEIGAGTGHIAKTVLAQCPAVTGYTLSDISRPRLEGIRNSLNDQRVNTLEMDADHPPAELAGTFDAIILVALIEHLIDPIRAMQQLRTLLKPGGFVYVDTPNMARYTQRIKLLTGRFPSTGSKNEGFTTFKGESSDLMDEGHLHYFTFRSLAMMLTDFCGYEHVEKLPYPGGAIPLGRQVHMRLARLWPQMFSELLLVARNPGP